MFVDRPVGIDLGTTNSEIALLDPSERDIHVYADKFGRRTVPSAVAWDPKEGAFLIGRAARARRGAAHPPIESIKRRMGQAVKVEIGPSSLSPEEVSSKILGELCARMREDLGSRAGDLDVRVARAVITVPAYFDAPQVEATRKAGELAGLEVIGVLQEPTAAAIYHTWKSHLGNGNFLVYDLGGGTFDVSILRCLAGEYQVLAIEGDNYLGGDDLDRRFAGTLREMLAARGYALDLDVRGSAEDAQRFQKLVHLAQEIKESLSTSEVIALQKENVLVDRQGEPVSIEAEIGREAWDRAVGDLIDTTIACCERAIARSHEVAGVGLADIDHVILVGGSTRAPLVIRRVTEALCAGKSKCEQPLQDQVDTCVALGAAIHAAQIGGLRLGDERAQALLTTPLVARGEVLRLGTVIERAPEGASEVAIVGAAGELGRADLAADRAPVRIEVRLGEDAETAARLELRDRSGKALSSLPLALYRGELKPRASALSQPSVVAKDIALEVMRGGRRERRILIARGASLPLTAKHELATGDRSGAVVLRILQNRLPIKTLMLEVPADLPIGTPVTLTLGCDEAMRLEARAEVAGRELWARIEPPAQAPPASVAEIEALLAEAEIVSRSLWGRDALAFRREHEPLATGLRELAFTDAGKLASLAAQLRQLIDELKGRDGGELSPPLHRLEHVLDTLRRVVYRQQGALLGMDSSTWEARLSELDARARAAWDAEDATAWRRAYNEVQALLETAQTQEHSQQRLDDPGSLARRATGLVAWSTSIERSLLDFVPSSTEEVRGLQTAERDRLLGVLQSKVRQPLETLEVDGASAHDIRRQLDAVGSELERIDTALERLPSIGLVTERR